MNIILANPRGFCAGVDRAIEIRDELCEQNGWFNCNQFNNPLNIKSHEEGTAEEIVDFFDGEYLEYVVTGTGTGGTLMGCKNRLDKKYPLIKMIAVEPAESPVMSGGEPGLHGIQGIGDGSKFLVDMKNRLLIRTDDANYYP